ncbi:hypothetical protein V493_01049 [Pseudogymnoascus sp. VKM F-4281 (FW-2241)]|nr:hypothetical protein V493_01049 [Pseudogymnoascus sp. VKM F-4281 (FW-2241)]
MDHGSIEWKDGLLEITLAMNTQIHSTVGCAPAELLFRDRSSYINWLNSQAWKDLSIGVEQEDPTMAPIFESELEPELEALIDPQLQRAPKPRIEVRIESSSSEPELSIELRIRSSQLEPDLNSELGIESSYSEPELGIELEHSRLNSKPRAQAQAQPQVALELGIEPELRRA